MNTKPKKSTKDRTPFSLMSKSQKKKYVSQYQAPKTARDAVFFERMNENGICQVESGVYSSTLKFSDVNYQIARTEEQINIFKRYCEVLNSCAAGTHLQVDLINRRMDDGVFKQQVFMPDKDDGLDVYRHEMNRIIAEKVDEGQNGLIREKHMTFSVHADTPDDGVRQIHALQTDLFAQLKKVGSSAEALTGLQRLALLQSITRPDAPFVFDFDWLLAEKNATAKDFIVPSKYDFALKNENGGMYSDRYQFGNFIGKTMYLRDIAPDMQDDLLSSLTDLPFDLIVSIHIDAIDQYEAIEMVKTKISYMNQEIGEGMTRAWKNHMPAEMGVRFEVKESLQQATKLLDDLLNKNQKLFKVAILIHTFAETNDELDARCGQICATVNKKTCRFENIECQQLAAMNSILPLGVKWIDLERTLTTANAAIFVPFTTQELFEPNGSYMGLNARSRNLIMCNRRNLASPSGIVLGQPGSGKSMDIKNEMINTLMHWTEDEVIVIDPEGEYTTMAKNFNGEVIEISAAAQQHVNPMDITENYSDSDNPLRLKSQFLMSFCELITGEGITAQERTYIDRAARATYAKFFARGARDAMPTLMNFYQHLKEQGAGAEKISTALSIYVDGTLDVFAHPTNVDTTKKLIVYNIVNLGKQLQTLGMMVVLDQIWNRVTRNRQIGRRTWIYVDEFQLLLNDEYCSNYFFEVSSRARKWFAILTSVTQHVETALLHQDARRMLSDCQYVKLFNQHQNDRQHLGELLGISDEELSYITNADPGCGLLIAGKSIIPFVNRFPKNTELYKMMTTNPNDLDTHRKGKNE